MKTKKIILRIIVSPFVFVIILIPFFIGFINRFWLFLKYGGEWISYGKDDKITMQMIFDELKENSKN